MRNGESSKAGDATRATSLALVEAFRDLLAEHLTELELLLITQAVSRGEVLMRQGDAADALYLVASGRSIWPKRERASGRAERGDWPQVG